MISLSSGRTLHHLTFDRTLQLIFRLILHHHGRKLLQLTFCLIDLHMTFNLLLRPRLSIDQLLHPHLTFNHLPLLHLTSDQLPLPHLTFDHLPLLHLIFDQLLHPRLTFDLLPLPHSTFIQILLHSRLRFY